MRSFRIKRFVYALFVCLIIFYFAVFSKLPAANKTTRDTSLERLNNAEAPVYQDQHSGEDYQLSSVHYETRIVNTSTIFPIGRLFNANCSNCRQYQYKLNTSSAFLNEKQLAHFCDNQFSYGEKAQARVIFLVISGPGNIARRNVIRSLWGKKHYSSQNVKFTSVFIIGHGVGGKGIARDLADENARHSDILFVNMDETYDNLTLKTVHSLAWVAKFCSIASHVIKIDDDVVVRAHKVANSMVLSTKTNTFTRFYAGHCLSNLKPHRHKTSKWHLSPQQYAKDTFPITCLGPHYMLSTDILWPMLEAASTLPWVPLEDVFVGLLVDAIGVRGYQQFNNFTGQMSMSQFCHRPQFAMAHLGNAKKKNAVSIESEFQKITPGGALKNRCDL